MQGGRDERLCEVDEDRDYIYGIHTHSKVDAEVTDEAKGRGD